MAGWRRACRRTPTVAVMVRRKTTSCLRRAVHSAAIWGEGRGGEVGWRRWGEEVGWAVVVEEVGKAWRRRHLGAEASEVDRRLSADVARLELAEERLPHPEEAEVGERQRHPSPPLEHGRARHGTARLHPVDGVFDVFLHLEGRLETEEREVAHQVVVDREELPGGREGGERALRWRWWRRWWRRRLWRWQWHAVTCRLSLGSARQPSPTKSSGGTTASSHGVTSSGYSGSRARLSCWTSRRW